MNPRFKKLALATSIGAALGAAALPSQAMVVGEVGEALLVPLVRHTGDVAGAVNTYIKVTIPDSIGFDTIPNTVLAPHTTPTNLPGPTLFPRSNGGVEGRIGSEKIHWYWFDQYSIHQRNESIDVSPGDVVWIDWLNESRGDFAGQPGYMVIGTEIARTGVAANFAMFGEAWYEIYTQNPDPTGRPLWGHMVPVPVLPLVDGADGAFNSPVEPFDNVKYNSQGIPRAVSPLISGMRTNRSDGVLDDTTVFNLSLGDRNFPAIHVVWLDENLGYPEWNGLGFGLGVEVWDSNEHECSDNIDLPWELNYIYIDSWDSEPGSTYCIPNNADYVDNPLLRDQYFGYTTYFIPEYIDTGINRPESSGVAFAITMDWDSDDRLRFTSSPAQVRGTYK